MKSLIELQTWQSDRIRSQLLQAHRTWRTEQEALKAQYNAAAEDSQRRYMAGLKLILRRLPEASDLLDLTHRFDEVKQAEDAEENRRLDGESEGQARIRRAVENGTKARERLDDSQRRARESLGIFRTPEEEAVHRQLTRARTSEELSAAKKIDEEFRQYRALIQSQKRKP